MHTLPVEVANSCATGLATLDLADVLRYLAHEAQRCRDRDEHEMHVLLYPSMLRVTDLKPMTDVEAAAFTVRFHEALRERQRVMTGADFQF